MHIQEQLVKLIQEINNVTSANKIYLFGSYAYGEPNENSDVDLCIVINNTDTGKRELVRSIRSRIAEVATIPVDVLVYDEYEFLERAYLESTMEHMIAHEGVCVYEQ
ncbi:nucleotidyltransferase domain-containing protein [Fodinisporobacter ferrooxydans]|uniref:Nucleotidyltransferase domain-containing protein n=1 Tax=Fodinisporobacter ferrooxydans TaxID=2901836 RepID=A0ABY4CR82_9BACL|nr:nucleotidyltransferase domain-containing protein [Alicyclobacillaceae bacterium MYW30-H2]